MRVAVVGSRNPTHQSAVVGASLASRLVPTLRDTTAPIGETISALDAGRPRILVGYTSALRPLAREQHDGQRQIAPPCVFSAPEVLSDQAVGISSPCQSGRRHLYGDLVVVEPVDDAGNPVPPGTIGARLW